MIKLIVLILGSALLVAILVLVQTVAPTIRLAFLVGGIVIPASMACSYALHLFEQIGIEYNAYEQKWWDTWHAEMTGLPYDSDDDAPATQIRRWQWKRIRSVAAESRGNEEPLTRWQWRTKRQTKRQGQNRLVNGELFLLLFPYLMGCFAFAALGAATS